MALLDNNVEVRERSPGSAVVTYRVSQGEKVFEGHYPGFPIFPGVCVVECVRQGALAAPPVADRLRLAAVVSTRFLSPVFPGDELAVGLDWAPDGVDWRCVAEVNSPRGRAALVKLRFEREVAA